MVSRVVKKSLMLRAGGITLLLAPACVTADTLSSTSFTITRSVFDNGGGESSSSSYKLHSSQGQGPSPGASLSTGFRLYSGYISIPESDGDGFLDDIDNCLSDYNPDQLDTDLDSQGNVCDTDDDDDGLDDATETVLGTNTLNTDSDGDGLSDFDEVNMDGDSATYQVGVDTDPNNPDTDGDGLIDGVDPDPLAVYIGDGDLAPYGIPDGIINAGDLLIARRIALGLINPTAQDLNHGDVYPPGAPDGVIDFSDLILIQQLVMSQP